MSQWWNVNKVVKVWSGHANSAQRKGDIYPPAGLKAIDEYQGSVEFNPEDLLFDLDGKFIDDPDSRYPGYWVRLSDLTKEQYDPSPGPVPGPGPDPVPVPGDISDEEAGAALRTIVNFILMLIRGK